MFALRKGALEPTAGVEKHRAQGGGAVGEVDDHWPFDVARGKRAAAHHGGDEGGAFSHRGVFNGGGLRPIENAGGQVGEQVDMAGAGEGLQFVKGGFREAGGARKILKQLEIAGGL